VRLIKIAAQEPYLQIVRNFFNIALGNNTQLEAKSEKFYSDRLKSEIEFRYVQSLTDEEQKDR
jgi:hypothetical protein